MTTEEKAIQEAGEFLSSIRGRYIVSQALYIAMNEINSRPPHLQEPSNVSDMKYIYENVFPIYREFRTEDFDQLKMSLLEKNTEDRVDPHETKD